MTTERPTYVLALKALDWEPAAAVRLRGALKRLKRQFGFQCVRIVMLPGYAHLDALRAQGIDLRPGAAGALLASPAELLTPEVRDVIRAHKQAILEALAHEERAVWFPCDYYPPKESSYAQEEPADTLSE